MERLIRLSVRHRGIVFLLAAVLVVLGAINAAALPIDAVPDITNKQVTVSVSDPSLGAEEIERRITFPLESALAGLPNVEEVRSLSFLGLSQVQIVFGEDTDVYFARQLVAERLQEAKDSLPSGSSLDVGPVSTGLGEIYNVKIENPRLSLMERRSLMDWTVRPQLRTVPGLAEVNTWGGLVRQYQVLVDPAKLNARGISMREVIDAVAKNNGNAGGGTLISGQQERVVQSVGTIQSLDDIRNTVVAKRGGVPVTVADLAQVAIGPALRSGLVTQDGNGEQVYAITMLLIGENGRVVVERVKDRLVQIEKSLPAGTKLVGFLDRSELIARTLDTALHNLAEGGLLVIVLLFLFLLQVRAGLIVSSAIPLAMLFAVIGMRYFRVSANLMSLGAVDFGLVVDGAVIIAENCVRRLAELRAHLGRVPTAEERAETVVSASVEVLRASVFGVFIIVASYFPILTLQDIEGKMFRPMGMTVILALAGALLLSVTLIPALCAQFLKAVPERRNAVLDRLGIWYEKALSAFMRQKGAWILAITAAVGATFLMASRLGSEFIPDLDEGALAMQVVYPPGTSAQEVVRRNNQVEHLIMDNFPDEVAHVVTRMGTSEIATDPMPMSIGDGLIELKPKSGWKKAHDRDTLTAAISEELENVPAAAFNFSQPIKLRMNELIEGAGIRADLGIKLFGPDMGVLTQKAREIAVVVGKVPGATDVSTERTQGLPQLRIVVDRARAARYGVTADDINAIVEAAMGATTATEVVDGTQRIGVTVRLPEGQRNDPESLRRLPVPTASGTPVPLEEVADFRADEGPIQISRENGERLTVIQSGVRGRDLGSFVQDVMKAVEGQVKLPAGYHVEYGGTFSKLQSSRARLLVVVPVTFAAVFALLFMTFGSLKQAVIVFTGIPLALSGGILALVLRGMPFSISAAVGFIALAGVAVLNGVVMVSFINQLRASGLDARLAAVQGALQRLRPVLMTASVAGFGFVPMAVSTGSGGEVQRPLATVVIGGLVTATLLTLFVLPTLYAWAERSGSKEVS